MKAFFKTIRRAFDSGLVPLMVNSVGEDAATPIRMAWVCAMVAGVTDASRQFG